MSELAFGTAVELTEKIRNREVGATELLELYLSRVEKFNPALNAIIVLDGPGARARAREADAALARGENWGPLHGLPITIKESFDWAGSPTTWGVPELKDNTASQNSVVVDRLLAAGAVLFGKTNVPLMLGDWQSFNDIYGTTNNPWALERTPGGSSGGAAAALAAGLTGLETG
ncbi:MAG: amidase family protein, partial [Planctomycetota bacterium]